MKSQYHAESKTRGKNKGQRFPTHLLDSPPDHDPLKRRHYRPTCGTHGKEPDLACKI
jgi:hypothetical protein